MKNKIHVFIKHIIGIITKPRNIYEVLMPLYISTKLVGLSSYHYVIMNKKPEYKNSLFGFAYSYCTISAFVAYYVFAVEERNKISYKETNKVTNAIDMYQLYGAVIVMTICIISNSLHQQTLLKAINDIYYIDVKIQNIGGTINHLQARNFIVVFVCLSALIFAGMEYMNCSMFLRQIFTLSSYCLLMCYIPMMVNGYVMCQYICYIILLKQRFSILNIKLKALNMNKEDHFCSISESCIDKTYAQKAMLVTIRQIHAELCAVGKLINKTFGLQMLIIIGNTFLSFTTHSYYCFDGFVRIYLEEPNTDLYNSITTGVWAMFKLLQLLMLCAGSSIVTTEANRSSIFVYKLQYFNSEISSEVYAFGEQLLHTKFNLSACDLFNIDMELFCGVICSATTYLMILLQVDSAYRQQEMENN